MSQWLALCWLTLGMVQGLPISSAMAQPHAAKATHPVRYFEIPVTDMNRAVTFYSSVLEVDLERQVSWPKSKTAKAIA
jgi:hypothetical protein